MHRKKQDVNCIKIPNCIVASTRSRKSCTFVQTASTLVHRTSRSQPRADVTQRGRYGAQEEVVALYLPVSPEQQDCKQRSVRARATTHQLAHRHRYSALTHHCYSRVLTRDFASTKDHQSHPRSRLRHHQLKSTNCGHGQRLQPSHGE